MGRALSLELDSWSGTLTGTLPFVSVIVPTYRDWDRLELCLDALAKQRYPSDAFEIIVVNNDPKDLAPTFPVARNVRFAEELRPGSYAARNKGLQLARGEILAFTDADCIPAEDWLENAVRLLMQGAQRLAGRIELFYRSSSRLSPAEMHEREFAFGQQFYVAHFGASATANMITWRKSFEVVGPFNSELLSGGDLEWGRRAHKAGIPIVYAPSVVVRHPARYTVGQLLAKRKRVAALELRETPRSIRNLWPLLVELRPPLGYFWHLARRNDRSVKEKLAIGGVYYITRLYDTYCRMLHLVGLYRPVRS